MTFGSSHGCRRATSVRPDRSAAEADGSLFRTDETLASYDAVARRYAKEIATELAGKPFDREFLDRFAASFASGGRVADLGCGPGHVAAYLGERGVDVIGLDVSPNMVTEARRLFPNVEFVAGDMLKLPFDDGSLAGVVAFYSILHFDDAQLERAFAEMGRVLESEAWLAVAFHVGDEVVHREQWWDIPVVLDARFLPTEHVTRMSEDAGFGLVAVQERPPYAPDVEYQSRRAYLVARPLLAVPGTTERLPPFSLGYPGTELRRQLLDAVLRGDKIATAGLADSFAPRTFEPLPAPGDRWALLGYEDEPVGVVETTAISIVRAADVDVEFARAEGEGFESVADWRSAHERFWSDRDITDDTQVVCEYFRLVDVVAHAS